MYQNKVLKNLFQLKKYREIYLKVIIYNREELNL